VTASAPSDHPSGEPGNRRETLALSDVDDRTLGRFYPLLAAAFGPEELMTLEELREARHSPGTGGTLVLDGTEPLACMVTEDYLDGRVVLLAYIVVAASARNTGLGSELLADLVQSDVEPVAHLVLAEIEDPRFHARSERGDPAARLRFYDRAGARLLPLPYVQPSLRPGSPRVDDMLLIALGVAEDDLDGQMVAAFLDEYFVACEGEDVRNDPTFTALRDVSLGDEHHRLPLHRIFDLEAARPPAPA
jgi:GNAT superfamily N-acetyltransferase